MNMDPGRMACVFKEATIRLGVHLEKLKPDALAYCGSSGAAFAFIAGVFHQLPVIVVRKEGERSHGSRVDSNATVPILTYIIVDDFICSGSTVKHIVHEIDAAAEKYKNIRPECQGIFLYASSWNHGRRLVVDSTFYDILV